MDPDSGPKNTSIIKFVPETIDMEHIDFEEINGEKIFSIAYLNDCDLALVTCNAVFDNSYNLFSCYINVELLGKEYKNIKKHNDELSLDDLFALEQKFNDKEKLYLSFDGKNISAYMSGANYKKETSIHWVSGYALKEDEFIYMDISDKMIEYLCDKLDSNKLHRNILPFKHVENIFKMKNISPKTLIKKVI